MQLLFEITPQSISAFEWDGFQVKHLSTEICLVRTDSGYADSLRSLIQQIPATDRFEQISCSYVNDAFTIVPASLFNTNNAFDLLQFSTSSAITKNETDYNRLPEWNCVAIYHLPMWIKSVLILKFPRIQLQHEITHLLRGLTIGSILPLKTIVTIHQGLCTVLIRKNGQILHASMQEMQVSEDMIYQLLVCYQRLKLTEKGTIIISYSKSEDADIAAQLQQQCRAIKAFEQQDIQIVPYHHLEIQKLCV